MTTAGQALALILAAGAGRRLGLGPKALLPWDGSVLVARAARAAIVAGLRPVVTAGPGRGEIGRHLTDVGASVEVVDVPRAETGMSASWRAGVGALDALDGITEVSPIVVMLVDQPGVGPAVLQRLVARFRVGRVVRAMWGGVPGHPVVMSLAQARAAAELSSGDEGARAWLRTHGELLDPVECSDLGDGADLDTVEDLTYWTR